MRVPLKYVLACVIWLLAAVVANCQAPPALLGEISFLADPLDGDSAVTGDLALEPGDRVQFVINYQDANTYYLLDVAAPEATFYKVAGGETRRVGSPGKLPMRAPGESATFTITHQDHRLTFIHENSVVCRGWDGSLQNGKAGYVAAGGQVGDPWLQPLGKILATDDFAREVDAQHMWSVLSGTWEIQRLRDDDMADSMEADKSANAFLYRAVGADAPAIAVAEQDAWYWTNYHVSASARAEGTNAMGLVLMAQDEQNYIVFYWGSAWASDIGKDRAQLVEVIDGQPQVLAEAPGGFVPHQWYTLDVAACDGHIVCSIDDVPVLSADTDGFGQGNAGLYAEGADATDFDDVVIEDYEIFREDFGDLTRWAANSGDWSATAKGEAACAGEGLLTSGRASWDAYLFECDMVAARGVAGLQVARTDDDRGIVFRVGLNGSPLAGKAQLVALGTEGETILSESKVQVPKGKRIRLGATTEGGFVRGYVDGSPIIEGLDLAFSSGGIGLYADAAGETRFDNVRVTFLRPKQPAHVTREFQKSSEHAEMAEWASRRAPWVQPAEVEPGATWWTKGDYFGDTTVTFKVRFVALRGGTMRVTLGGTPDDEQAGLHLILTGKKGERALDAQVLAGTEEVGRGRVELAGPTGRVKFSQKGQYVIVLIDDEPVIAQKLPSALTAAEAKG